MKTLIDANVILRYLLGDNEKLAEVAAETIKEGAITFDKKMSKYL